MKHRLSMLAFLLAASLEAQNVPLEFDAASVRPNQTGSGHTSVDHDGGSLRMTNVTLKSCITMAYGVSDSQVLGPAWLETERYDINAKSADDAKRDQHALRMQTLLADRFKLVVHRETREMPVYALVPAKGGLKIKPDPGRTADNGTWSRRGHVTAKEQSMAELAEFLASPRVRLGRNVTDATGLKGVYSFDLDWTPDTGTQREAPAADAPPSIFVALEEQLGLKLEGRKGPVEILIVDRVEKVPTDN